MWNMMCDVMPTITEDNIGGQRHQFSGEDVRINEFMDTVVDERNKLLETLSKSQIRLDETEKQLAEVESERNALQRQIDATFPKVRFNNLVHLSHLGSYYDGWCIDLYLYLHFNLGRYIIYPS